MSTKAEGAAEREVTPPRTPHEHRRLLSLFALLALAIQPLWMGCLPRADALFHLHRLAALTRRLAAGDLFPRWLPELGLGYGFPLFNYYAPLSYDLALPGLVLGTKGALLFGMAAAFLFLAFATYLWGKALFGVEAGVVAALLTGFAPYTLYDLYQRGAMAELWGLGFLVLTLWAVHRAARHPDGHRTALLAAAYAALLLAHNITAMVGTPLIWGYALLCAEDGAARRRLLAALLLGMGLSAFFWLPAFAEKGYVQIQNLYTQPRFDFHHHFLTLKAILAPPHPVDPAMVNPPVPKTLGWPALLLAVMAWLPLGAPLRKEARRARLLLTLVLLGAVGMVLPLSRPLWEGLPLLRFVQFPWRFLGEASVALAMVGGLGASRLLTTRGGAKRAALLLPLLYLIVALYALPWLFPDCRRVDDDLSPAALIRTEAETGGIGTTAAADYLPRWVERLPEADSLLAAYEAHPDGAIPRLHADSLPGGAQLLSAQWTPIRADLRLRTPQRFRLVLDWFYFPGWQAWVDGEPVAVEPWGEEGLLSLEVPAGEHRLTVAFGETPLRHGADLLSLIALGLWLGLLALTPPAEAQEAAIRPAAWLPPALHRALGVALLLLAVKTLYLDHADTLFAPHRFDGQTIHGVTVPVNADFSGQMRLVGYDPPARPLAPDREVPVALYWAASGPTAANYSVGLYLRDAAGHLYGQDDHQNPGGYPTSRLDAAHYIRDEHLLRPYAGTPPGRYRLEVSLYDQVSGQTLSVADAEGRFHGHALTVGEVEVVRPEHFPPVESLPRPAPLSLPLGDGLRFLGGDALPTAMQEGEWRTLVLYWQAERAPQEATRAVLLWLDEAGEPIATQSWVPGGDDHPPTTWVAGEIVRDMVDIVAPVMPQAGGDPFAAGHFTVTAQLRLEGTAGPLGEGAQWGEVRLERPPRTSELPPLDAECEGTWPSLARLRGYRLDPPQPQVGQPFTLTLYWEALGMGDRPYTVFVHLLRDGKIVAQDDAPPARGDRPTTSWLRGEIIADPHPLLIPEGEPPGCFIVSVGLYDSVTLVRIPLQGGNDHCDCPYPLHVNP